MFVFVTGDGDQALDLALAAAAQALLEAGLDAVEVEDDLAVDFGLKDCRLE